MGLLSDAIRRAEPIKVDQLIPKYPTRLTKRYTDPAYVLGAMKPDPQTIWDIRSVSITVGTDGTVGLRGWTLFILGVANAFPVAHPWYWSSPTCLQGCAENKQAYLTWARGSSDQESTTATTNAPYCTHAFPEIMIYPDSGLQLKAYGTVGVGDNYDVNIFGYQYAVGD